MSEPLRIGVVGGGAIGATLCRAIDDGTVAAELVGLCEVDAARAAAVVASLHRPVPVVELEDLAAACDVLVEAVSPALAPRVIAAAFEHGADVLVMSVAALLAEPDQFAQARAAGRRLHVPTGAIAGLDAVRAMAVAGLDEVTLTTRKPPKGLAGAPYVVEHGLDVMSLNEPTLIFEGPAREAVKGFPANVNVAAALSLAGLGADRTVVQVVVDPTSDRNVHRITAVGPSGRLTVEVENVPSPDNPKTSYLAALSAIALLQRLTAAGVAGS